MFVVNNSDAVRGYLQSQDESNYKCISFGLNWGIFDILHYINFKRITFSFSLAAVTNYNTFGGLKTIQICSFTLLWVRSLGRRGWFLCTGFHGAKIKVSANLISCLQVLCSFWLLAEFNACGCKTEVPVSFSLQAGNLSQLSKATFFPCHVSCFHLQIIKSRVSCNFTLWVSWLSLLLPFSDSNQKVLLKTHVSCLVPPEQSRIISQFQDQLESPFCHVMQHIHGFWGLGYSHTCGAILPQMELFLTVKILPTVPQDGHYVAQFYRGGSWSSERVGNLLKALQLLILHWNLNSISKATAFHLCKQNSIKYWLIGCLSVDVIKLFDKVKFYQDV